MVKDRTCKLNSVCLTLLVISYSIFPPSPENGRCNHRAASEPSSRDVAVRGDDIRFYLADLNRAINGEGELNLSFPGCFAWAAPFLLFRLKRNGFSNGRVVSTAEGLLLTATR
jgi:hypothetical protein